MRMLVPFWMRYFLGWLKLSVRNQPPMLAGPPLALNSSMAATWPEPGRVSTSLTYTRGVTTAPPSSVPGDPLSDPLGRQLVLRLQVLVLALGLTICSAKPAPSVDGYQSSL